LPYEQDNDSHLYTCVDIKTLGQQQQQNRYRKTPDVERLRPIHGNLDRRATEALKYLVEALRSNTIHRRTQAANASTANSDPANEQENSSTNKDQKSKVIVPLPYKATRQSSKILIDNKNHLTN
ncbi:unnamed protein product, partial [Adineta steineri]